jgi:hypothetical protein
LVLRDSCLGPNGGEKKKPCLDTLLATGAVNGVIVNRQLNPFNLAEVASKGV